MAAAAGSAEGPINGSNSMLVCCLALHGLNKLEPQVSRWPHQRSLCGLDPSALQTAANQGQQRARPGGNPTCRALCRGWHRTVSTGPAGGHMCSFATDDGSCAHSIKTSAHLPHSGRLHTCRQQQVPWCTAACSLSFEQGRSGTAFKGGSRLPMLWACFLLGCYAGSQKHSTHAAREESVAGSLPSFFSVSMKSCWRPAGGCTARPSLKKAQPRCMLKQGKFPTAAEVEFALLLCLPCLVCKYMARSW